MHLSLATTKPTSHKVGGGGNMRHAEVSQRHIFLKILSQNVRHNPDLVGGLVEKLSTVYGMWGIILVSFSYGYSTSSKIKNAKLQVSTYVYIYASDLIVL